jgi:hypothetical protein
MRKGSTRAVAVLTAALLTTAVAAASPAHATQRTPDDRATDTARKIAASQQVLPDAGATGMQFDPALMLLPRPT